MSSIILHEKYQMLREKLSEKLYEYEELVSHTCINIEQKYILEFGALEYKLYKLNTEIDIVEFKIKQIQKRINHEEEIDLNEINAETEKKFKDYEEKLKALKEELNDSYDFEMDGKRLSHEDGTELKKLYKAIIKQLHPDLNKNQSEEDKELFIKATKAFKQGNLKVIKSIYLLLEGETDKQIDDLKSLEELIKDMEDKIEFVKSIYPYNKIDKIKNKRVIDEYKGELNLLIENKEEILEYQNKRLKKMIKDVKH